MKRIYTKILIIIAVLCLCSCGSFKDNELDFSKVTVTERKGLIQIDFLANQKEPYITFSGVDGEGNAHLNLHYEDNEIIYEDDDVIVVYDDGDFNVVKDHKNICTLYFHIVDNRHLPLSVNAFNNSNGLSNGDKVYLELSGTYDLMDLGYAPVTSYLEYTVEEIRERKAIDPETINTNEILEYIKTYIPKDYDDALDRSYRYTDFNVKSIHLATAKRSAVTDTLSFIYIEYSYNENKYFMNEYRSTTTYEMYYKIINPYYENGLKWEDEYYNEIQYKLITEEESEEDYDYIQLY